MRKCVILTALTCVFGVLACAVSAQGEDTWSALGTYTQVLAFERQQRAQEAVDRQALALDTSSPALEYWVRRDDYYLDRSYHDDMRLIEREGRAISAEPFVRAGQTITVGRHRELYMRQRGLNDRLDRRDYLRRYYPYSYGYHTYPPRILHGW